MELTCTLVADGLSGHKVGRFWKFKREGVDACSGMTAPDMLGVKERKDG